MAKAASGLLYWGDFNDERHEEHERGREEGELRINNYELRIEGVSVDGGGSCGWVLTVFSRLTAWRSRGRSQQMRTDRIARVLPVWEGLFSLAELFSMLGT